MKILSLDQSTKVCGYSIFGDKELIKYGSKTFTDDNVIERISKIKKWLNRLIRKYKPDIVVLEQIQYQQNPLTHKILAELLGVLEVNLYEKNITYFVVSSSEWRSTCKIKGRKRKEQKKNAQLFVKKKFRIEVNEDTADAICLGWHSVNKFS